MKKQLLALVAIGLFGAALQAASKPVMVSLKDGEGKDVGTAKLSTGPGGKGVKIALNLKGLPAGEHAIHIHKTAVCEGPKFTTAEGHFNPGANTQGATLTEARANLAEAVAMVLEANRELSEDALRGTEVISEVLILPAA